MANRDRQRLLKSPAAFQPLVNGADMNANLLRPVNRSHGFSVKCQQAVVSPIAILLAKRGPATIGHGVARRAIAALAAVVAMCVVFAIQSVGWTWRLSHRGQEEFKRIAVAVAHQNATASPMMEVWVIRVVAALNSVRPDSELSLSGIAVSPILPANGSNLLCLQAAAASRVADAELGSWDFDMSAAIAAANPACLSVGIVGRSRNYNKSLKALARDVSKVWRCWPMIASSHDLFLSTEGMNLVRAARMFSASVRPALFYWPFPQEGGQL